MSKRKENSSEKNLNINEDSGIKSQLKDNMDEQNIAVEINGKDESEKISIKDSNDLLILDLTAKVNDYKNTAQRIQAEFENFRKRNEDVKKTIRMDVINEVVLDFLTVLDSVDSALSMVNDSSLREGVVLIGKQFTSVLSQYEIEEINPLNQLFDPCLHNAIMQEADPDNVGKVLQVLQKGYQRKGKVIRYATVKVAV